MHTVFLGLGSNLGNSLEMIEKTYSIIQENIGDIVQKSSVYKTKAWGFESQYDFYNTVIKIHTHFDAFELLTRIKNIEKDLGRTKKSKNYEDRVIDIDILYFSNQLVNDEQLIIPHPQISSRNFVLYPLEEIASEWIDPVSKLTVKILKDNSTDEEIPEKMELLNREIQVTADGSKTIFIPAWNETYHSNHGAIQEAEHVFIQHGFNQFLDKKTLHVLEIGFGTGLNALLTLRSASEHNIKVHYTGIEAFPVNYEMAMQMEYETKISTGKFSAEYEQLHASSWEEEHAISTHFTLMKNQILLQNFKPEKETFDLIYFDAFGPRAQEEMWNIEHFNNLFHSLKENGIFVTYCAKGQVKRDLKTVGFEVESLPGPPGKREMTRAKKFATQ
jgi:2-amino-4-hydroxy-6-hydroxymethyldihydropteridine diphosphokinase